MSDYRSEYIKKGDILDKSFQADGYFSNLITAFDVAVMPPADVVKVRHGKWIKHRDEYDCEYIECSVCGENFYPPENAFEFDIMPKYCQECGAKMDRRSVDDGGNS